MRKLRCKSTDVDKYLPDYFIEGGLACDDNTPVFHYLLALGCMMVVCLTLFMGTVTWSEDREIFPAVPELSAFNQEQDY